MGSRFIEGHQLLKSVISLIITSMTAIAIFASWKMASQSHTRQVSQLICETESQ
jgi:hypothetical protein